MGLEAICAAALDGQTARGKALLETTELIFRSTLSTSSTEATSRSAAALRARVPLAEVESVTVAGTSLTLKWRGRTLVLDLGPAALTWAAKIKNPPTRLAKLGVKPGARVALSGPFAFEATFAGELAAAGAAMTAKGPVDVLFYAPTKRAELDRIPALMKRLDPAGALWIVRPKGKDTPVTESDTRKAGLAAGLVDVKVAAFSATHTAEKFVIPVAKRKG
jgi:hypothetical protein